MADRCEPPEGLRYLDGWHWVFADRPVVCQWLPADDYTRTAGWKMPSANFYNPITAYNRGYRYLAPVTPPAEVAALRAEIERLEREKSDAEASLWRVFPSTYTIVAEGEENTSDPFEGPGETYRAAYERLRATVARLEADLARLVEAGEKVDAAHAAMLRAATLGLPNWFERTEALNAAKKEFAATIAAIKGRAP